MSDDDLDLQKLASYFFENLGDVIIFDDAKVKDDGPIDGVWVEAWLRIPDEELAVYDRKQSQEDEEYYADLENDRRRDDEMTEKEER